MKHLEGEQYADTLSHASTSFPMLTIQRPECLAEISTFTKVSKLKLTVGKQERYGKYFADLATAFPIGGSSVRQPAVVIFFMDLQKHVGFAGEWQKCQRYVSGNLVPVTSLLLGFPVTFSIFTAAMLYLGSFIHPGKSRYNSICACSKTGDLIAMLVLLDGWYMTMCFEVSGLQLE